VTCDDWGKQAPVFSYQGAAQPVHISITDAGNGAKFSLPSLLTENLKLCVIMRLSACICLTNRKGNLARMIGPSGIQDRN